MRAGAVRKRRLSRTQESSLQPVDRVGQERTDELLNRSFWKGRRVFLTGHTGFKGSWLSLWLNALGAEVTGYALDPPTQPNLFEQAKVAGMRSLDSR